MKVGCEDKASIEPAHYGDRTSSPAPASRPGIIDAPTQSGVFGEESLTDLSQQVISPPEAYWGDSTAAAIPKKLPVDTSLAKVSQVDVSGSYWAMATSVVRNVPQNQKDLMW